MNGTKKDMGKEETKKSRIELIKQRHRELILIPRGDLSGGIDEKDFDASEWDGVDELDMDPEYEMDIGY